MKNVLLKRCNFLEENKKYPFKICKKQILEIKDNFLYFYQ